MNLLATVLPWAIGGFALALLGIQMHSALYFGAALVIAMLGVVGTVALSKYLLRGDIVE